MQLAKKFKAAKLHLLQQLVKQCKGPAESCRNDQQLVQTDSLADTVITTGAAAGSSNARHSRIKLKPLQQAMRNCMQKTTAYMLGRGGSDGPHSIHDSSPYSYAITLEDTDLLRVPAVVEYTRRVWYGLDVYKIALAWDSAAAPAVVAANCSRNSSTGWGLVSRKGNTHARQRAAARKSLAVAGGYVPRPLTAVDEAEPVVQLAVNPVRRKSLTMETGIDPFAALSVLAAGTGQASLDIGGPTTASSSMELTSGPQHAATSRQALACIPEGTLTEQVSQVGDITAASRTASAGSALVQSSLLFQTTGTTAPPSPPPAAGILVSALYQAGAAKTAVPIPPAVGSPSASRPASAARFFSQSPGPVAEAVEHGAIMGPDVPSNKRMVSLDVGSGTRRFSTTSVPGADGSGQGEKGDADMDAADAADALAWLSPDVGVELLQVCLVSCCSVYPLVL